MTSEQGGPPPYGPPPGPPPYGQYGPPPYGPYGYAPAPSTPAGPPPEPRERPLAVRAGLGAFVGSIVLGLASLAWMAADWDTYLRRAVEQQAEFGADPQAAEFALGATETIAVIAVVVGLLFSALYLLFVWFAWRGYGWARIVLWVLGGLGILSGLSGLAAGTALPSMTVLAVFQTLALVVGVVLLAARPANQWFAYEKWRRSVSSR